MAVTNPVIPVTYVNRLAAENGLTKIGVASLFIFENDEHATAFVEDLISRGALAGGGDMLAANNLSDLASAATAMGNLGAVGTARTIVAAGLATGGGDLSANRTITVPAASQAEAEAGEDNTKAMTALRTAEAIAELGAKTAADVGLPNVNNTTDDNKPVSLAQAAADVVVLTEATAAAVAADVVILAQTVAADTELTNALIAADAVVAATAAAANLVVTAAAAAAEADAQTAIAAATNAENNAQIGIAAAAAAVVGSAAADTIATAATAAAAAAAAAAQATADGAVSSIAGHETRIAALEAYAAAHP